MGMDVYGKEPKNEKGEYFRNNLWWWRPLWDLCCVVGMSEGLMTEEVADGGHFNDGAGLDDENSVKLAEAIQEMIDSGAIKAAEEKFNDMRATTKLQDCDICGATGIRTDELGMEQGFHDKALDPEIAKQVGRDFGYCNACKGLGKREPIASWYGFSEENVRNFVEFLRNCGGFEVL